MTDKEMDEQLRIELETSDKELAKGFFDYQKVNTEFFLAMDAFYRARQIETVEEKTELIEQFIKGLFDKQAQSEEYRQTLEQATEDYSAEKAAIILSNMCLNLKALLKLAVSGEADDIHILINGKTYLDVLRTRKQITVMLNGVLNRFTEEASDGSPG